VFAQADLTCLSQQLAAARCMLPAGQLQLIHAFRELVSSSGKLGFRV
jgi:hypothetical protein